MHARAFDRMSRLAAGIMSEARSSVRDGGVSEICRWVKRRY
jgi:hypothetical protein